MSAILERCRLAGIRLRVEGADLRCDAPKGALTSELQAALSAHKPALLEALAHPDPAAYPPLAPAAEARRQKVLAMLARAGGQYAALVEDPNSDPVILALATPNGTCELRIPRDRYDPFAVLELVRQWEGEDVALWRVAILEPGGWTLADWEAYAERYHGPGCPVTAIAGLPKPRGTGPPR